jgi:dTDP-4-amino-4,6-dideoxygalactose transaminase
MNSKQIEDYEIKDPWDWVTHFENELAEYTGYKYAIACDSNSNAIRLVLHYLGFQNKEIKIPAKTYVSVPNQIILSGNIPVFEDKEWNSIYELDGTPIVDAATGLWENMALDYHEYFMILSFHLKKILNIGTGGMILTNDKDFEIWSRPMIYDGRHKNRIYNNDEFECIGWHMYMTPEQAKRGLEIFNSPKIQPFNKSVGGSWLYGDLRKQKIFKRWI